MGKARKKKMLIFGVGINDVEYCVSKYEKQGDTLKQVWLCPYYQKWRHILERCYSKTFLSKYQTYYGCYIHPSWIRLTGFIEWVDSHANGGWVDLQPDKDLLVVGNREYGPDTVVFVNTSVNNFILDSGKIRGKYALGAMYDKACNKFRAECLDPFKKNKAYLGVFNTELEAHKAWQAKKHEYACQLADLQTDHRVAKALRERYAPDKDWTNA